MPRLKRACLLIGCLCLLLLLIKSNNARPAIASIFSEGEKQCVVPCLFGIYVGQSTSDARGILASHPLLKDLPIIQNGFNSEFVSSQWGLLFLEATNDNETVKQVWIDFRNTNSEQRAYKMVLGDIVVQLGNPSFIKMYKSSDNLFGCSTIHYIYAGNLDLAVDMNLKTFSCYGIHDALTMIKLKKMRDTDLLDAAVWPGFIGSNVSLLNDTKYIKDVDAPSLTAKWNFQ